MSQKQFRGFRNRLGHATVWAAFAAVWSSGCEPDLDSLTAGNVNGAPVGGSSSGGSAGSMPMPDSCEDGQRSADESDVDCGGESECSRCELGDGCTAHSDCKSAYCVDNECTAPTCSDGVKNGSESDADCGAACAPGGLCDIGDSCTSDDDCTSEYCNDAGECTDHCESGTRDADETDADCGGPTCAPCAVTLQCEQPSDCVTEICSSGVCVSPTCDDELPNQGESDVDCGAVCGPEGRCTIGESCGVPEDCDTYVCTSGECVADIVIAAGALLDDMEDGNKAIGAIEGRTGAWYAFGDGQGISSFEMEEIVGMRGPSEMAAHTEGSGFITWGSGIGFDLNNVGADKGSYDASQYSGVTFWGKAAAKISIKVVFPDQNTDPAGGNCTTCDHHWFGQVQLDTKWKRFTVNFADLVLEAGTVPTPSAFASNGLVSIQFRAEASAVYDFWIDDIAFVE